MSTVTIGCKLANGILMNALVKGKVVEQRINGWNQNLIQGTGHGITHDVSKDLWDAWHEQFKESKLVKGGFIFAHAAEKKVKDEAKDKKTNKAGTEQLPQLKENDKEGALGAVDK